MGVLTAKARRDFDDLSLEVEGFKIVGKPIRLAFWRQFVLVDVLNSRYGISQAGRHYRQISSIDFVRRR